MREFFERPEKEDIGGGLSFTFVIGKWAGFHWMRGPKGVHLTLGFFGFGIYTYDMEDRIMSVIAERNALQDSWDSLANMGADVTR